MDGVKIVTIGGGSSYTPELMEGFINRYEQMPVREIWLVDIEAGREKLEIVGAMAQRMWDATPYQVKIHLTMDRREALKDADFVTTQFRVGLLNARIKDERIPLSYGMLGQETNGAGGMFKCFRTVPVILGIVEDMKELCPNAWLINFTNPSGMITEAVMNYGQWNKVVGLCNVPVGTMIYEPMLMGVKQEDYIYQFAGLNHFHYHRVWNRQGREVTEDILEKMIVSKDDPTVPNNIFNTPYLEEQLRSMHMIPCPYHRYYYLQEEMLNKDLEEYNSPEGTRAQQVQKTEHELFELYKDPHLDHKPEQLAKRGGAHYSDAACETIVSIYGDRRTSMVLSTRNNGCLPDLPSDCVVEVTSILTAAGPQPVAWGPMPPAERGWLQVMKAMEQCTIQAAVTGDYGLALQAFALNPMVVSGHTARRMLDEMLVANEAYLPQFGSKVAELKQQRVEIKDPVARELTEKGL